MTPTSWPTAFRRPLTAAAALNGDGSAELVIAATQWLAQGGPPGTVTVLSGSGSGDVGPAPAATS